MTREIGGRRTISNGPGLTWLMNRVDTTGAIGCLASFATSTLRSNNCSLNTNKNKFNQQEKWIFINLTFKQKRGKTDEVVKREKKFFGSNENEQETIL